MATTKALELGQFGTDLTVDDSTGAVTIANDLTINAATSTGIDDNADQTVITIGSDETVTIAGNLEVSEIGNNSTGLITIDVDETAHAMLRFQEAGSDLWRIVKEPTNELVIDQGAGDIDFTFSTTGNFTVHDGDVIIETGGIKGPSVLYIDPATYDTDSDAGSAAGTVRIRGDLIVDGDTTTINSTTLTVDDLNVVLASGAADSATADGAGITIDGASATLTYSSTDDKFVFNKALDAKYTRVVSSGAATSPTDGLSLEIHYVTSGRTQGEGAYLIPYDRDNSQYKPLTIDAQTIRLVGGNTLIADNLRTDTFVPSQRLHVYDPSTAYILAETGGTGTSAGHRATAGSNDWVWYATEGEDKFRLYDYANSAVRLTVKNNGRVGIGTEDPSSPLEVNGEIYATVLSYNNGTGDATSLSTSSLSSTLNSGSKGFQIITSASFTAKNASNNPWIFANDDGVDLYSSATKRVEVTDDGINVVSGSYRNGQARHSIRPSLLLDFANSKVLDPRINFSRSTTAYYYDGKSEVIGDQNICPQSGNITTGTWASFRNTITTGQTDPFNGTDAVKITGDGGNGVGTGIYVSVNYSGEAWEGNDFTLSVYAKSDQTDYMYIGHNNADLTAATFDLSGSGNTVATPANHTASIIDIGNGWKRVSITFDISVIAESNFIVIGLAKSGGLTNTFYNTNESVYLYGPQVVNRNTLMPYIASGTYGVTKYQPQLIQAAVNEPRFDHNPATGKSKGLLIEKSKTNSIIWSQEFNNWTEMGLARRRENLGVAPDGTQTAEELYLAAGSNAQNRYSFDGQVVLTAGTYTFSCYMKSSGLQYGALTIFDGTTYQARADFDLINGTVATNASGNALIENVGNGWYRCMITGSIVQDLPDANRASGVWPRYTTGDSGAEVGDADRVGQGILVWGAQLDTSPYATSYMPTSGSTNTRSPDIAQVDGTNFSNFYTYSDSAVYVEWSKWYNLNYNNETASGIKFGDGGGGYVDMIQSAEASLTVYQGGRIYYDQNAIVAVGSKTRPSDLTLPMKEGMAWKDGEFVWASNYETVSSLTPSVIPKRELNTLHIGRGWGTTAQIDGHVRKIAYYPARLSNNEITALVEE